MHSYPYPWHLQGYSISLSNQVKVMDGSRILSVLCQEATREFPVNWWSGNTSWSNLWSVFYSFSVFWHTDTFFCTTLWHKPAYVYIFSLSDTDLECLPKNNPATVFGSGLVANWEKKQLLLSNDLFPFSLTFFVTHSLIASTLTLPHQGPLRRKSRWWKLLCREK